jgi:hypothetical protein
MLPYLNVLCEEIVCEYMKCAEVPNLIELENNLHIVVWEGIVSPSYPTITCKQDTK